MNPYLIGGVAIAVVAILAGAFYAGGAGPRAELARFKVEVTAAGEKAKAQDAGRQAESKAAIAKLENDHAQELAQKLAIRDRDWARRVPGDTGGSRAREPVRLVAGGCTDRAGVDRLADAIQRYRDGLRAAVDEYRGRARQLLHACETDGARKADALAEVHEWVMQERKIYAPEK